MIGRLFRQSPFLSNTVKLVTGAGIAQIISLLAAPLLTRLYTPSEFGTYTFFIALVGGFGLIITLRYEMAIILQKSEKEAVNMTLFSVLVSVLLCVLLGIFIGSAYLFFPGAVRFGNPQWLFLLPALVLLVGLGNVYQHWFNRKNKYFILSVFKVLASAGTNGGMLWFGIIGAGVWGLLGGFLMGSVVSVLFMIILFVTLDGRDLKLLDTSSFAFLAKRHRDLPAANTPQVLIEMLQSYGIVYLSQLFFTAAIIGWYSLSMRVLQAPLYLIGTSVSQVFYKNAVDRFHTTGDIQRLVLKTIRFSATLAAPFLLILLIIGPALFSLVFGSQWKESGEYARILAPWMFFDFIRNSVAQIPLIVRKTRFMFFLSVLGTALMIASMCIGGLWLKDVKIGFIILSVVMSLYSLGVTVWIVSCSKQK